MRTPGRGRAACRNPPHIPQCTAHVHFPRV
jgi:hypothetical protein